MVKRKMNKNINSTTRRARALRNNPTDAEKHLWQKLKSKQLNGYKFRRQFPIGNYIVDFICLKEKLIIELDGGQHLQQVSYDKQRETWLKGQGFRVLRFWNDEILNHVDEVLEKILSELDSSSN